MEASSLLSSLDLNLTRALFRFPLSALCFPLTVLGQLSECNAHILCTVLLFSLTLILWCEHLYFDPFPARVLLYSVR
jgi:hypothetical protein